MKSKSVREVVTMLGTVPLLGVQLKSLDYLRFRSSELFSELG